MDDDSILVLDDGNPTFLAAELFPVNQTTDFNCKGYCVPASIGAKLMNPEKTAVGIVGEGAFLRTGLELNTASSQNSGVSIFYFYDGELSQILQGQPISYGRKTCTVLGEMNLKGLRPEPAQRICV
ncbi:thiamine pyrophosphate-dependent enzyme [Leptospira adleri]|uniref:thiamine pyrophosphate-dependent enzyme n=1 Tax=Leptospira adleri TaxID=2023186 RepID=UPI001FD2E377|nr:thiamine pyrophosphate-dependent enzyme [Leptospira adleri]